MKTVKVEKYIHNTLDETLNIPVAFIRILAQLLPTSALAELQESGLDFKAIIDAYKQKQAYRASADIEEQGIMKHIVITLS